jgi:hypothetical protein
MTKILTDPFHDIKLYHKAPLYLLRGERIDPMQHVHPGSPKTASSEFSGSAGRTSRAMDEG